MQAAFLRSFFYEDLASFTTPYFKELHIFHLRFMKNN